MRRPVLRLALCASLLTLAACGGGGQPPNAAEDAGDGGEPEATVAGREPDATPGTASTRPSAAPAAEPADRAPAGVDKLPDGSVTLVTLGDSLTEGSGDEEARGGYTSRLLAQVEAARPGSHLANFGRSGWTSLDVIEGANGEPGQLDPALEAVEEATRAGRGALALVLIGSNDLWYLYEYGPEAGTGADAEAEDLARYATNVATIVERLRAAGAVVVLGLVDDQSRRPVAADDAMRRAAFPGTSSAEVARMSAQARAYNDALARLADESGAGTVDFWHSTVFTDAATLDGDGNHPNAAGYDEMAARWFAVVGPLL